MSERVPLGELSLIFMAAAGFTLILAGWALRRFVGETPRRAAAGRRGSRGRLPGTVLVILGGFLLGVSAMGTVIALLGDPVGKYLTSWGLLPQSSASVTRPITLEGASGAQLYGILCAGCHGETGSKVSRVDLSSAEFLVRRDKGNLAKGILQGGGSSHNFGKAGLALTEAEVGRLVSYIRSLEVEPPTPTPTPTPDWASLPGVEAFRSSCSCHAAMTERSQDPEVFRPYATRPRFHDYTGQLDPALLNEVARFLTSGKRVDPEGPFGGAVRHVEDWISKHPPLVKQKGAGLCLQCHQNSFCIRCHTARP